VNGGFEATIFLQLPPLLLHLQPVRDTREKTSAVLVFEDRAEWIDKGQKKMFNSLA